MKNTPSFKNVDAYLKGLPKEKRVVFEKLRKTIKATAPKAQEVISYGMPGYKYHGMLVYFAAFANHLSFFPGTTLKKFKKELKDFKTSKGTIQFTLDHPLPTTLVKKIVKARMKENEARAKKQNSQ